MMFEFEECASCKAKPGSHVMLCESCVNNRASIAKLKSLIDGAYNLILGMTRDERFKRSGALYWCDQVLPVIKG